VGVPRRLAGLPHDTLEKVFCVFVQLAFELGKIPPHTSRYREPCASFFVLLVHVPLNSWGKRRSKGTQVFHALAPSDRLTPMLLA
jgi:hypothetical protein